MISALEYSEPAIDMLVELKNQLRHNEYVFVIGYSFKDEHIIKIFQHAAKKNQKLVLFLVSPSGYQIYDERLRYYESYNGIGCNGTLPSKLQGRVICLPYKLEKILAKLSEYLDNLIQAEKLDSEFMFAPAKSDMDKWKQRLRYYIDCEHMEKVENIIEEEIVWNELVSDDWKFSFELGVKGTLNRLMISNKTNNLEDKWRNYFAMPGGIFSVDKFIFVPQASPPCISLGFKTPAGMTYAHPLAEYLRGTILPIIESKLQVEAEDEDNAKRTTIAKFLERVTNIASYLMLWSGDNMTFEKYYNMRHNHDEIEQFKKRSDEYITKQNKEAQQPVREIIELIERDEIHRIYEADALNITSEVKKQ